MTPSSDDPFPLETGGFPPTVPLLFQGVYLAESSVWVNPVVATSTQPVTPQPVTPLQHVNPLTTCIVDYIVLSPKIQALCQTLHVRQTFTYIQP